MIVSSKFSHSVLAYEAALNEIEGDDDAISAKMNLLPFLEHKCVHNKEEGGKRDNLLMTQRTMKSAFAAIVSMMMMSMRKVLYLGIRTGATSFS